MARIPSELMYQELSATTAQKNRVGRVPGTRTGAADLDYEGNVYTEKRVMWETLSPESTNLRVLNYREFGHPGSTVTNVSLVKCFAVLLLI